MPLVEMHRKCSRCGDDALCIAIPASPRMPPLYICAPCLAIIVHMLRAARALATKECPK